MELALNTVVIAVIVLVVIVLVILFMNSTGGQGVSLMDQLSQMVQNFATGHS